MFHQLDKIDQNADCPIKKSCLTVLKDHTEGTSIDYFVSFTLNFKLHNLVSTTRIFVNVANHHLNVHFAVFCCEAELFCDYYLLWVLVFLSLSVPCQSSPSAHLQPF